MSRCGVYIQFGKDGKTLAYRFTWKSGGRLTLHRLARSWRAHPACWQVSRHQKQARQAISWHTRGAATAARRNLPQYSSSSLPGCLTSATWQLLAEGLEGWTLLVTEGGARLEKKSRTIEFDAVKNQSVSEIFLVLVDSQGAVLCSPLWLNSAEEVLPKPLHPEPVAATSLRYAEGDASGHLLLFKRSTLDVNTLRSADGEPVVHPRPEW